MDAPFGKTRAQFFRRERQAVKKEDNRYTVSRNPFDMQRTTGRAGRGPDDGKNDGDQKRDKKSVEFEFLQHESSRLDRGPETRRRSSRLIVMSPRPCAGVQ